MTRINNSEVCDGCGCSEVIFTDQGSEFCKDCHSLLANIRSKPALIRQLSNLSRTEGSLKSPQELVANHDHETLPEVMDAVRYRTRDREMNTWYVSVSEIEGQPIEIFASTAFDRDQHLQSRISNLTTITRLISLILRHIFMGEVLTLEKTLKQMRRSSRQTNDLPDMLASVLSNYRK